MPDLRTRQEEMRQRMLQEAEQQKRMNQVARREDTETLKARLNANTQELEAVEEKIREYREALAQKRAIIQSFSEIWKDIANG